MEQTQLLAGGTADSGRVEFILFGEFISSRSKMAAQLVSQIMTVFARQLSYVYRHYPDPACPQSMLAARAAEAARQQACFGPMYHALFSLPSINETHLISTVCGLGLNLDQFMSDLYGEQIQKTIESDQSEGRIQGIYAAPTLVVGGHQFHGKLTQARLVPVIRQHLYHLPVQVLDTVNNLKGSVHWSGAGINF